MKPSDKVTVTLPNGITIKCKPSQVGEVVRQSGGAVEVRPFVVPYYVPQSPVIPGAPFDWNKVICGPTTNDHGSTVYIGTATGGTMLC